jgi:hypothetical protein
MLFEERSMDLKARVEAALALTKRLIESHGPRLAGSEASPLCADELARKAEGVADSVVSSDFAVRPGAFLGFIRLLVVLYALGVLALPFAASAAAVLASVGVAVLVLEFFLYREPIDPFFPRRIGRNVHAVLEPSGRAERQLIVSGHHDSARVFNFYIDRPERYAARVYGSMGSFAAFWLASLGLAALGAGQALRIVAAVLFAAGFTLVAPLWRFTGKEGTPGAGDNLVASAIDLEIAREFRSRRDAGAGLTRTRLVFASFDAEEAGLRGARAWVRANRPLLSELPTWHYNMDCIYSAEHARFLTSDVNGSVKLDEGLARDCAAAAEAEGYAAKVEPIAFMTGGTDAAETARAGVRATTLLAMPWSNDERSAAYHTPADTIEAVSPRAVELALKVGIRIAEGLDRPS